MRLIFLIGSMLIISVSVGLSFFCQCDMDMNVGANCALFRFSCLHAITSLQSAIRNHHCENRLGVPVLFLWIQEYFRLVVWERLRGFEELFLFIWVCLKTGQKFSSGGKLSRNVCCSELEFKDKITCGTCVGFDYGLGFHR